MNRLLLATLLVLGVAVLGAQSAVPVRINIPYEDAGPIVSRLPATFLPAMLRGLTSPELKAAWPKWVSDRDREIRSRLMRGDDDSVVNFVLFGVTFTKQRRITERDMDEGLTKSANIVQARTADFITGIVSPGSNERLQFAREVVERGGIKLGDRTGRDDARRYLNGEVKRFLSERKAIAERAGNVTQTQHDADAVISETASLFQNRGLSSDTTIFVDFAIEEALKAIKSSPLLAVRPGSLRRIAIVGPGLDFADKREGFDFYPPQTIQPFAVADSLIRLGLANRQALKVTTFDVSPRINQHLLSARERARSGTGYVLQLPLETTRQWNPSLTEYWRHLGDSVGEETAAVASPATVKMRAVRIRPSVVAIVTPKDLNIVLQRVAPLTDNERFDLVIATNILVYYDEFEQALALVNVWSMLRPGGLLVANSSSKVISAIGATDVRYGATISGDRVYWYQKSRH